MIGPGRKAACKFGRIQQFFQINSSIEAHAFQKIDKILRREIPTCAGAIRATAQACGGRVKFADSCLETRKRIGQPSAICVMEMKNEILTSYFQFA